ncbi:MAG: hypothetical protein K2K36_10245 [Muribaculaceae bacterium]|nr:hypothetical protein [Muribaculaceae bacterium]
MKTNPWLTGLINGSELKGLVGIVFSDWVLADRHTYRDVEYEVKGNDLVTAIIENNFGYIDRFILDDELFTPIEDANNWNDKDLLRHCHNKKTTSASLVKKTPWSVNRTVGNLPAGNFPNMSVF